MAVKEANNSKPVSCSEPVCQLHDVVHVLCNTLIMFQFVQHMELFICKMPVQQFCISQNMEIIHSQGISCGADAEIVRFQCQLIVIVGLAFLLS